jgi:hypothetical protein
MGLPLRTAKKPIKSNIKFNSMMENGDRESESQIFSMGRSTVKDYKSRARKKLVMD